MKKMIQSLLGILAVLFFLNFSIGCSSKTPEELEAEATVLYEEGDRLWTIGKEMEAFPFYDKIANEYPETEVAKALQIEMKAKGLGFGSAGSSWTIIKLYEIENTLVEIFQETGEFPETMETGLDAWGQKITYKVFLTSKVDFDFMVISGGPDAKMDTGDDIRLVHARDKRQPAAGGGGKPGGEAAAAATGGFGSEEGAEGPGGPGGGSQETTLAEMDASMKALEKGGTKKEKELGLDQLGKAVKKKKKGEKESTPSEKEIDLNELLKGNF